MPERSYAYESHQDSLFKPYYQRWLWDRILKMLPAWLAPNAMTAIATLCCAASFVIAIRWNQSPLALLLAGFLIIAYLSLDNLDGAQARRLGKSTRLGEFLDHWLDTLNNGFVVIGACVAAGLPPHLTLAVLCCGTIAFFSVQWELRTTGVFRMGRIADIEGNTAVALLYFGLAIFGQAPFHRELLPGVPTLATLLGCGVIAQALWTTFSAVRRTSHDLAGFLPLVAACGVLGWWAWQGNLNPILYLVAGFFLNPVFTSRPIRERLQLAPITRALDWAIVAAIALAASLSGTAALGTNSEVFVHTAITSALAALTLGYFVVSVARLRHESNAKSIPKSESV